MKKGFTLIELIMVVAILGIVSTLAVMRIGNVRERAARQVSIANQSAIGRAIDSWLTVNGSIDRLDSLLDAEVAPGGAAGYDADGGSLSADGAGFYAGPDDAGHPVPAVYSERCAGLTPNLREKVLVPYTLGERETAMLVESGIRHLMRHASCALRSPRAAYGERGDDGAFLPDDETVGLRPDASACIARAVTNRMIVAAISPFTPEGRAVHRDFGQALLDTKRTAEEYRADRAATIAEVNATGGPLLAFGLGAECTAVGGANGGLESAPFATYPLPRFYRRYIAVFRLPTAGRRIEFAGVLDPCGNTIRAAQAALR